MPFVRSVEQDAFFTCYSVVDERSAVYFAIGVSLEKGEAVALSCTSAQATRNYIPGMTEAFYRNIPLVVMTSDYKPSLIGQGVMQAIEQMSIPEDTRKISVKLPIVATKDDAHYCGRLVNEALLELDHHGKGPVHIDIPTEELWAGDVESLPAVTKITRYGAKSEMPTLSGKRIMVAIGQHDEFTDELSEALGSFAEHYGAIVYTNHLSNYHGRHDIKGNLALAGMDKDVFTQYSPDILITIGGQIGDYAFDGRMQQANFDHWRVSEDGKVVDTYKRLSKIFECSELDFFNLYAEKTSSKSGDSYYQKWLEITEARVISSDIPLSHARVAATLSPRLPKKSIIHFAILNSFRNWSMFELDPSIRCYSNVAAFGIDGCLSTFIGQSVATDDMSFLVIGDLSFFYDMNAIGIRHIKSNARVVLVNNKGGGEFRLFSHAANEFGDDANKHIAAAGHNSSSAEGWVKAMGWKYISVTTESELENSIAEFTGESDVPIFMEVSTTMQGDSDGVQMVWEANTRKSIKGKVASKLSPKMKRTVKKMLKK